MAGLLLAVVGLAGNASGPELLALAERFGSEPASAVALETAEAAVAATPRDADKTTGSGLAQPASKPGCRGPGSAWLADCTSGRPARLRSRSGTDAPPGIAAVAIGNRHDPALLSDEGVAAVIAALPERAAGSGSADPAAKSQASAQDASSAASPVNRAEPGVTTRTQAAAPDRSTATAKVARADSRGDSAPAIKSKKPERERRSAKVSVRRQPEHGTAAAGDDEVVFRRARKELGAFAQTLDARVPRQWLDLARQLLE
ncbi:MAG TPA: hypothetical protein VH678_27595 [Xanthobacteraceae bacterium]|jgi:hypothetical protein